MRCVSTRGGGEVSLTEAIAAGLAPDGGLFLPTQLPQLGAPPTAGASLPVVASWLLRPFFEGEALAGALDEICARAFTFAAPLRWLEPDTGLLELFHGPTAAFKDFGARFLAECTARIPSGSATRTVLVATSGDTGAAVAAAFHRRPGFRVLVLYPDGRVSARQAHQLGAFGDNVHAFRVAGSFDDCQRMVKAAFLDRELQSRAPLLSANSISLGRLLPQMAYYAHAALHAREQGLAPLSFVVPTGNLGNAFACLLAREVGLPIGRVVLATNANRVLVDYLATGCYEPRDSIATLANAMDVGAPSNVERLRALFADPRRVVEAEAVEDTAIRATIASTWRKHGVAICPHTACGVAVLETLRERGARGPWVVAATAHPAKFDTIVEPAIGAECPPPAPLAALLARPAHATPLQPSSEALSNALLDCA
ncbi:MAG: threonine synthase [Planctomycetota bacterium]